MASRQCPSFYATFISYHARWRHTLWFVCKFPILITKLPSHPHRRCQFWSGWTYFWPFQSSSCDYGVNEAWLNWEWAGHVCRMHPVKSTQIVTQWTPEYGYHHRGRPKKQWQGNLVNHARDRQTLALDGTGMPGRSWRRTFARSGTP